MAKASFLPKPGSPLVCIHCGCVLSSHDGRFCPNQKEEEPEDFEDFFEDLDEDFEDLDEDDEEEEDDED